MGMTFYWYNYGGSSMTTSSTTWLSLDAIKTMLGKKLFRLFTYYISEVEVREGHRHQIEEKYYKSFIADREPPDSDTMYYAANNPIVAGANSYDKWKTITTKYNYDEF
jgi:hypothetical protein